MILHKGNGTRFRITSNAVRMSSRQTDDVTESRVLVGTLHHVLLNVLTAV
jgi:hypothetical protein